MTKAKLRSQYPDIAQIVDEIREHMSIEKMVFPYNPEPWTYWWVPSPKPKKVKGRG